MVHVSNFTYGPVTPVLGFVMSSLGCFLGLRAATRARASHGARRVRWLLLATVSIATTGIWVMHFVAMLGFTIPGQTITYSVPVTILSMLIAVIVVGIGLLIVGFGSASWRNLLTGGVIIGFGVASMHYIGMAAMKMPDTVRYNNALVAASVLIAVVAGTAALWAAVRLATVTATLVASLIMGVAVSGMHYTGIAAMRVYGTQDPGMLAGMSGGVSAQAFLLPLIIGISLLAFVLTVIISLSPTEEEMREDAALMAHLSGRSPELSRGTHRAGGPPAGPSPGGPGQYGPREDPGDQDAGRWFRPQSLALRGGIPEPAPRPAR
ncbi:MAG TPA: MHYT domain-containing protein [Streptosporangiaceae bacterium]|jgi:NO-binding membrane sensor protein with MHYT domain